MREIESYIIDNHLSTYKSKFQYVFGNYSETGILLQDISIWLIRLVHIYVGVMCVSGFILNIVSLSRNVKVLFMQPIDFVYALVVGL